MWKRQGAGVSWDLFSFPYKPTDGMRASLISFFPFFAFVSELKGKIRSEGILIGGILGSFISFPIFV